MRRITKYRPSPATAIAIAAFVVALGGAAFAAIPDSNGTIHGCYHKANGSLRLVESADRCRSNERPIDWNQQGQPGTGTDREIIARARSTATTPVTSSPTTIPLTGNTWTQGATTTNLFLAEVTWAQPASCVGEDFFVVRLRVNDEQVDEIALGGGGTEPGDHTFRSRVTHLLDPGQPTPRTLTATAEEIGIQPSPPCGFIVTTLRVNVAELD